MATPVAPTKTKKSLQYSTNPVFTTKDKTGFRHNFYIMYHATSSANVETILQGGFNLSSGPKQMLGDGIYCSLTIKKAYPRYGDVAFRLLVYTGKTYRCTQQNDEQRVGGPNNDPNLRWQKNYASCWVPPNSKDLNPSGLEENCIRGRNQIRILGIAKGWDKLDAHVQALGTNTEGANTNQLSDDEMKVLSKMRGEVGESWTMIEAPETGLVLDVSKRDEKIILWNKPRKGQPRKDNQLFKIWHDRTIRSKLDPEKKICVSKEDGEKLCLANDATDETNMFRFKFYEQGCLKNNNWSSDTSLYITAKDFKRGENVLALPASPQEWCFPR